MIGGYLYIQNLVFSKSQNYVNIGHANDSEITWYQGERYKVDSFSGDQQFFLWNVYLYFSS